MINFTNLNFNDLKSARARFLEYFKQKFLFYQWDVFADKIGDASQYLKTGPRDNPVLIFHWLIQFSPVNNQSGFFFSNQEIRDITFSESRKKSFYKTASSVGTGMFSSSSSMMSEQHSGSDLMSPTIRERNKRKLHHGAYQHLVSKQYQGLSRSEQIGVVYIWGKDQDG